MEYNLILDGEVLFPVELPNLPRVGDVITFVVSKALAKEDEDPIDKYEVVTIEYIHIDSKLKSIAVHVQVLYSWEDDDDFDSLHNENRWEVEDEIE